MFKKAVSVCLAVLIMIPAVFLSPVASADGINSVAADNTANAGNATVAHADNSYLRFLEAYPDAAKPDHTIPVNFGASVTLKADQKVSATINVPEAGLYVVKINYTCLAGRGTNPVIGVLINNEYQYSEAEAIKLNRIWKDVNVGKTNCYGDEIVPSSEEVFEPIDTYLTDIGGYYGGVLSFYLNSGVNTVAVIMENEDITLNSFEFTKKASAKPYKDVAASYDAPKYDGEIIKIEAEDFSSKSATTIYRFNDASSAGVTPYSIESKKLNTTGGTAWSSPGSYIEWTVDVPKDGLYALTFKTKQNTNVGVASYRNLTIDGEMPFAECEDFEFKYSVSYENSVIGKENKKGDFEPYLFQLKAGKRKIRMTVSLGQYAEILSYIRESADELGVAYRQIIMLTTANPDAFRDYAIDENLPQVIETFKKHEKQLNDLKKELEEILDSSSTGTKVLETLALQLEEFLKDPFKITERLTHFKTNITSLTDWIQTATNQPLQLDYIMLSAPEQKLPKASASFWATIKYEVASFINTFTDEYLNFTETEDSITVWASAGQVSMNAVQELVEDQFIEETGIQVNIKYVTASILMALVAGKGPDVALSVGDADIMNWAFRDAVVSLEKFKGYDDVAKRFRPSAIEPVTFEGKVYGIPRTQTWTMMYIRTDILEELGIKAPNTWQEVISVMSALKKKNLEFGIPLTMYPTLLYQYGGKLYNNDLTKTDLTSLNAISSFHFYSSLFTDYSVPKSFSPENRLRTGEMPIVISDYTLCNTLSLSAPEIQGKWSMELLPGYQNENGSINRSVIAATAYSCILCDEDDEEKLEKCWKFLEWWTSDEIQYAYSQKMEQVLGVSARVAQANIETFNKLGWNPSDLKKLNEQAEYLIGVPAVPGNYYTSRHLSNAMNKVLYSAGVPAEELTTYSLIIDNEIERKRDELGFNKKKGGE